ncbi:MAG: menaquinone biosynthesis protein [Acidobacteriaceae bacterium]|nr:menaquinone biosynthesis protein [Acidobacteriaceae bacterium]
MEQTSPVIRVGAVSYLNTVPLVWGMLHGPQRGQVELSFSIPSACSDQVERGDIAVGLVPLAEIARQELDMVPGVGISCFGAVRSILLFSKVPWKRVRTLAVDLSSRTSVELARIILCERFGVEPAIAPHQPDLNRMLSHADAALVIGDPALRLHLNAISFEWLDLGAEWLALTGLPFVFAAWAGKAGLALENMAAIAHGSYEFGKAHLADIAEQESPRRGISRDLAERYFSRHIRFELGSKEQEGVNAFLQLAGLGRPAAVAGA